MTRNVIQTGIRRWMGRIDFLKVANVYGARQGRFMTVCLRESHPLLVGMSYGVWGTIIRRPNEGSTPYKDQGRFWFLVAAEMTMWRKENVSKVWEISSFFWCNVGLDYNGESGQKLTRFWPLMSILERRNRFFLYKNAFEAEKRPENKSLLKTIQ